MLHFTSRSFSQVVANPFPNPQFFVRVFRGQHDHDHHDPQTFSSWQFKCKVQLRWFCGVSSTSLFFPSKSVYIHTKWELLRKEGKRRRIFFWVMSGKNGDRRNWHSSEYDLVITTFSLSSVGESRKIGFLIFLPEIFLHWLINGWRKEKKERWFFYLRRVVGRSWSDLSCCCYLSKKF